LENRKSEIGNREKEDFTQRSQRKSAEYTEKEKRSERRDAEGAEKREEKSTGKSACATGCAEKSKD
jgi:hypothetical protein